MITSDKELEMNSHPANTDGVSGAPVLDGQLATPERANVNAIREALDTQKEMEVGKPIGTTEAEKKEEITMSKSQGGGGGVSQIIINIAGKEKKLSFSNVITAQAFIKKAQAQFGGKFKLINAAYTSGMSDIDAGAPNFSARQTETGREYVIQVGNQFVVKSQTGLSLTPNIQEAYRYDDYNGAREASADAVAAKSIAGGELPRIVPASSFSQLASNMNLSPGGVPSQVVQEFYPEIQHEIVSYPNATNDIMQNPEITGDPHELGTGAAEDIGQLTVTTEDLPDAISDAFEGMTRIGYISTSPAGGAGIGRDGKPQILEGTPLRKENDIRGPMFTDEFYANYNSVPGAALTASMVIGKKVAANEEKNQFSLFLKKVMGEVAASFIAGFKVTSRMPMNKVPGVGEIQLAQVEQPTNVSAFNMVNTGSRVKYLLDKLTDSEIQDGINEAYAQGSVWHSGKEGGFVYEVFVRAETIDTESMILKYKFITGSREAGDKEDSE